MILSALCKHYQRLVENKGSDIPLPGHTYLRITHVFEISKQGNLERVIPMGDSGQRSQVPWSLEAACRKSNIAAYILVDKPKYALGFDGDTLTPESGRAFRSIVADLGARTRDEGILAVHRFLRDWDPQTAMTWDDKHAVATGTIAFKLQGDSCLVHERPDFRKYWTDNWLTWGGRQAQDQSHVSRHGLRTAHRTDPSTTQRGQGCANLGRGTCLIQQGRVFFLRQGAKLQCTHR